VAVEEVALVESLVAEVALGVGVRLLAPDRHFTRQLPTSLSQTMTKRRCN
jgi:hypothetical protein